MFDRAGEQPGIKNKGTGTYRRPKEGPFTFLGGPFPFRKVYCPLIDQCKYQKWSKYEEFPGDGSDDTQKYLRNSEDSFAHCDNRNSYQDPAHCKEGHAPGEEQDTPSNVAKIRTEANTGYYPADSQSYYRGLDSELQRRSWRTLRDLCRHCLKVPVQFQTPSVRSYPRT